MKKEYKQFNVTFTERKRYNPVTRTILVEADSEPLAHLLTYQSFGGFRAITIDKVEQIGGAEEVVDSPDKSE
jgi:hypothetical protein